MNKLDYLFRDAHRRAGIQQQKEGHVDLNKLWSGLGYPSEFKGKARVFFRPVFGERSRRLGWYKFTDKGRDEYLRLYAGKPGFFDKDPSP